MLPGAASRAVSPMRVSLASTENFEIGSPASVAPAEPAISAALAAPPGIAGTSQVPLLQPGHSIIDFGDQFAKDDGLLVRRQCPPGTANPGLLEGTHHHQERGSEEEPHKGRLAVNRHQIHEKQR